MTVKTIFICDICQADYETDKKALQCEARGVAVPRYSVGEVVYCKHRYPNNPEKKFAKRTITAVEVEDHFAYYGFDRSVQVGKGLWIGDSASKWFEDSRMAKEGEFYRLGEPLDEYFDAFHKGQLMNLDLVDKSL